MSTSRGCSQRVRTDSVDGLVWTGGVDRWCGRVMWTPSAPLGAAPTGLPLLTSTCSGHPPVPWPTEAYTTPSREGCEAPQ